MFEFCGGFVGLGHMHVHLVPVEVCVVGGADRQVETESVVGEDLDSMAHHAHPVQGGLTVEENEVSVLEHTLHDHTVVEVFLDLFGLIMDFYEIDDLLVFLSIF